MALSAVPVGLAALMERSALKNDISGANGFVLFIVLLLSAMAILPLLVLCWFFGNPVLLTLLGAAAWLVVLFFCGFGIMALGVSKKK